MIESNQEPSRSDQEAAKATPLLVEMLRQTVERGGSDLHIAVGEPPAIRLHGLLVTMDRPAFTPDEFRAAVDSLCDSSSLSNFRREKQLDISLDLRSEGLDYRFRVNLFELDHGGGICMRVIPNHIPTLEWAGIDEKLVDRLIFLNHGLVVLTGATGSGKTTTLAMIIDRMNRGGGKRIITIEEPIEYQYSSSRDSMVTQREVGSTVTSFADGLKAGLRQDPDVILVGEVRDQETAEMVLAAAETGHLVFTTLHTRDCKGAISRFAGFFPQAVQHEVRYQLSMSLRAIIGQRLLPALDTQGERQLAMEVLWNTTPIASAIRNAKLESIDNYLITGRDSGMCSFDESVAQLMHDGKISREVAESNVREVNFLDRYR